MVTHLQLTVHAYLTLPNHHLPDQMPFRESPAATSLLPNSKFSSQNRRPCLSPNAPRRCVRFLAVWSEGSKKFQPQADLWLSERLDHLPAPLTGFLFAKCSPLSLPWPENRCSHLTVTVHLPSLVSRHLPSTQRDVATTTGGEQIHVLGMDVANSVLLKGLS